MNRRAAALVGAVAGVAVTAMIFGVVAVIELLRAN